MAEPASPGGESRSNADVGTRRFQFNALVKTWSGELYRYACWLTGDSALAQDLVQETFLRAWRALDSLREPAAAKSWLITILRRERARLYERKSLPSGSIDDVEIPDTAPGPEHKGEHAVLRNAIARLDPKYREPLVLQVLGGFSCAEIASQLGITEAAVMTQVFRARQQLKASLGENAHEADIHELS
ncbi:MAG: sigma-70 family RNA polymerase sigma factor [Rhodanobacteraceae bacterium]